MKLWYSFSCYLWHNLCLELLVCHMEVLEAWTLTIVVLQSNFEYFCHCFNSKRLYWEIYAGQLSWVIKCLLHNDCIIRAIK